MCGLHCGTISAKDMGMWRRCAGRQEDLGNVEVIMSTQRVQEERRCTVIVGKPRGSIFEAVSTMFELSRY